MSPSQNGKLSDGQDETAGKQDGVTYFNNKAVPPPQSRHRSRRRTIGGAGFGRWYSIMRWIGQCCDDAFFREVEIIGGQDFPKKGPVIVVCTHFATIIDVAIISAYLPHRRKIHYWAKRGLFRRRIFRWILNESGNIQVDRKSKNNQALFAGTFEALSAGEVIGLFPEGGSFTEPHLHAMKAGAAWAALEYAKHLALEGDDNPDVTNITIVPTSINYTDKSRFRSRAVFEFGPIFSVDEYSSDFLDAEGSLRPSQSSLASSAPPTPGPLTDGTPSPARLAVAALTNRIGRELQKLSINAPDWPTWHAARVSRELLWSKEGDLDLKMLKDITNSLITIFLEPETTSPATDTAAVQAKDALVTLQALQIASRTDTFTYNRLATVLAAHKRDPAKLPATHIAAGMYVGHLVAFLVRMPYAIPITAIHAPGLLIGWGLSKRYASHEEESMGSAKVICAFVITFFVYVGAFFIISAPFLFTPPGMIFASMVIYALYRLSHSIVDDLYDTYKLTCASARVFSATLSLPGLGQLTRDAPAVLVAKRAIEDGVPIPWTYKKAAKLAGVRRPAPSRLFALALATRAQAIENLKALLEDRERNGSDRQRDAVALIYKTGGGKRWNAAKKFK